MATEFVSVKTGYKWISAQNISATTFRKNSIKSKKKKEESQLES